MQPAPAVDLFLTLAALFQTAQESGKPAKVELFFGITVKVSPSMSRREFQVWNRKGSMLGAKDVDRIAKAAGMISHVCREVQTEAGVAGLYVKDRADWGHLCLHDWTTAEQIDTPKEKGSLQTCRVCGSVAGTLEKKRSKKGPRPLYNGHEVHADALTSLMSSGPLPLDLTPERRTALLAAVQARLEAVRIAEPPPPLDDPAPWEEAAAAPPSMARNDARDEPPPSAAPRQEAPAERPGPYRNGLPYPSKAADRIAGKLYWADVADGCVAFFTLTRDVHGKGSDKVYSEHFASGYVWTPETSPIPGSKLVNRKIVFFERLTAPALAKYLKGFRLVSSVTVDN